MSFSTSFGPGNLLFKNSDTYTEICYGYQSPALGLRMFDLITPEVMLAIRLSVCAVFKYCHCFSRAAEATFIFMSHYLSEVFLTAWTTALFLEQYQLSRINENKYMNENK